MAVLVTATEVKSILQKTSISDTIVDVFIGDADLVIKKVFENDTTLGSALIKSIERWFTAHMLSSTLIRSTSEEKLGDASVKYTGKWDKNLESTPYGQMVMQLDVTGKLAAYIGKKGAGIYSIKSFD